MLSRIGELRYLTPVGLMTMPPYSEEPEDSRPSLQGPPGAASTR